MAGVQRKIGQIRCQHFWAGLLLLVSLNGWAVESISITVERVQAPSIKAKNLNLEVQVDDQSHAKFNTAYQLDQQNEWAKAALKCEVPSHLFGQAWECDSGKLQSSVYTIPFDLDWHLNQSQGKFIGANGRLRLDGVAFSDAEGLHAAEGLKGVLDFSLVDQGGAWQLHPELHWTAGELYWEPYYVEGEGHQLAGDFLITEDEMRFDKLSLQLNKVGTLKLTGQYDLNNSQLRQLNAELPDLNLSTAFPLIFKPLLAQSILQQTDLTGRIAVNAKVEQAQLKSFDLRLHDVSVKDQQQHFAFEQINAHIPWDYDAKQTVTLSYQQGQLRSLPLGATQVTLEVNRYAWTAPQITMPILDGVLELNSLSAARLGGRWYWHLGADIKNLGMPQLSQAFGWPAMQGSASVHIPLVTYGGASLRTDGEMVFKVFDGETTVSHLSLEDPLGNVPRLSADVTMRSLDLGLLTETFSFGSIEGKLDGDVRGLVLQSWQPVAFDARFISSPGRYRKKISQRAVENISALGGAGAVAAIQRSVLRFFKAFNYDKIGLSCRLSHDVCTMDGLPDAKAKSTDGGYLIVKGRGIPAISVKGFNQAVSWDDLLSRVQRITNENTEAVVR